MLAWRTRQIAIGCAAFVTVLILLGGFILPRTGTGLNIDFKRPEHPAEQPQQQPDAQPEHIDQPEQLDQPGQKKPDAPEQPEKVSEPAQVEVPLSQQDNNTIRRYWTVHDNTSVELQDVKKHPSVSKIMGLIFYGRRNTVSILDCYLRRNLVKNGGMLDGVIWVERTSDKEDLAFLNKLVDSEPAYTRWTVPYSTEDDHADYAASYDRIEDDVLYIKIDDDIVFIEDTTIPALIETKFRLTDSYTVSANVVNQPMMSWMHWNLGAIQPYLPEYNVERKPDLKPLDWRPSSLPVWSGPKDFDWTKFAPTKGKIHRWLPVKGRMDRLRGTPIKDTEYNAMGNGWKMWQIGAQQHYSFLEHLENEDLSTYRFKTWDFQYARMGIQFIAIMGWDINAAKPIEKDDEEYFSVIMPKKLGRHAIADGRAVVSHYSFFTQYGPEGIGATDILERYRTFAKENICASDMLWTPAEEKKGFLGKIGGF